MRTGLGDAGAGDEMLRLRTPPALPFIMFCNNVKLFRVSFLGEKVLERGCLKVLSEKKTMLYILKKCVFLNKYQTLHTTVKYLNENNSVQK